MANCIFWFFKNIKLYLFPDKIAFVIKVLLAVSPLGKTTRCDPGMLPIMSSSHSKEQATSATKTTSTKKNIARHTVPDCRGRTIDSKSKGWREKREHFCQINTQKQQCYHITSLSAYTTTVLLGICQRSHKQSLNSPACASLVNPSLIGY